MHPLLEGAERLVVGHRGNSAHAPENTLESFRQAVTLGVDAIEFDVRATADGRIVVHHDPTLGRTTSGSGALASMTLAQIASLDAGAQFTRDAGTSYPYRDRGVGVPTLDAVLAEFSDTPLLIEVKTPAAADGTRALIERHGAEARTIVDAFDSACLDAFRDSRIAIGSSRNDVARLMAIALSGLRPRSVPYRVVCVPERYNGLPLPVTRFARALRPLDVPVHVWTVNDPRDAERLWASGVSAVISDDPGTMMRLRQS